VIGSSRERQSEEPRARPGLIKATVFYYLGVVDRTRTVSDMYARHRRNCGFTLIELVITVAIVGLLASAAMPLAQLAAQRSKETDLRASLRQIRNAIDAYKLASDQGRVEVKLGDSGYPPTLQTLVDGVEDARSENNVKMYFLRRIPRDPFFPDGTAAAADTWGFRSYASPPDAPQPGDDVYDVYSLAGGKGINGVPYHDW
jgi:general secretion pathway protein G